MSYLSDLGCVNDVQVVRACGRACVRACMCVKCTAEVCFTLTPIIVYTRLHTHVPVCASVCARVHILNTALPCISVLLDSFQEKFVFPVSVHIAALTG